VRGYEQREIYNAKKVARKPEGKISQGTPDVDKRIILKAIFKEYIEGVH
jgi:hypothetical protein